LSETLCPRFKFNVGNISLLRKSTADAKADPKLWKTHSDGDAIIAADFGETLDNETLTEPDDILIEEYNVSAFRNIFQEAVGTGEATDKSPELLRILQTTTPIAEDFHHFCGSFSTLRNGDFIMKSRGTANKELVLLI
jgi:hypothetical protein